MGCFTPFTSPVAGADEDGDRKRANTRISTEGYVEHFLAFYPEQSIATALAMTPTEINRMVKLRLDRQTGEGQPKKFATMAEYEAWKASRVFNDD